MAFAVVILGGSLVSYHQVLAYQRGQLARSLMAISDVATLPSPLILTNFDAIRVLDRTPPADLELLELLLTNLSSGIAFSSYFQSTIFSDGLF
jgi:hypothetical protein